MVGGDLQSRGIYAMIASLLAITIYIGFRFRFSFAVGAIAATLHDVFVTLAFLMFFGYEMSLNVVGGDPDDHRLLGATTPSSSSIACGENLRSRREIRSSRSSTTA